jgi:hypothetical protein
MPSSVKAVGAQYLRSQLEGPRTSTRPRGFRCAYHDGFKAGYSARSPGLPVFNCFRTLKPLVLLTCLVQNLFSLCAIHVVVVILYNRVEHPFSLFRDGLWYILCIRSYLTFKIWKVFTCLAVQIFLIHFDPMQVRRVNFSGVWYLF